MSDVLQPQSEGLRTKGAIGVSLSRVQENTNVPAQPGRERRFTLLLPFCSIQAFCGLDEAHTGEGCLFTESTDSNAITSRNTHTDTPRNNI